MSTSLLTTGKLHLVRLAYNTLGSISRFVKPSSIEPEITQLKAQYSVFGNGHQEVRRGEMHNGHTIDG